MQRVRGKRITQRETYGISDAELVLRKGSDGSLLGVEVRYYSGVKQQAVTLAFDGQELLGAIRKEVGE